MSRPLRQNAAGLTGIYLPEDVVIMLDELEALGSSVADLYKRLQRSPPLRQRWEVWHTKFRRVRDEEADAAVEAVIGRLADRVGPREGINTYNHIVSGMGRALFVEAYASFHEHLGEDARSGDGAAKRRAKRLLERFEGASNGGDWSDVAPGTPAEADVAAVLLAAAIADMNDAGWIEQVFDRARRADIEAVARMGGTTRLRRAGALYSESPDPRIMDRLAAKFGSDLALMALGTGVSWFDDHADFPLEMPRIETMVDVDDRGRLFFECSGCR